MNPVIVRPYTEADAAFVRDAWIGTAVTLGRKTGLPASRMIRRAKGMFASPTTRILVAANAEDHSHLFGFVAFSEPYTLHWIYVAARFREFGIARELAKAAVPTFGERVTIATTRCARWAERAGRFGFVDAGDARQARHAGRALARKEAA